MKDTIFIRKVLGIVLILLTGFINPATPDKTINPHHPMKDQGTQKTLVYECSNAFFFTARIKDKNVWLFLPKKTLSLTHVPSASGAKYSDGLITFWTKGDLALLETGDQTYHDCKNNRAKAIWEGAKLDGIDFRAVGNEPGWYLEITDGDKIVFVSDYGNYRYEFTSPEPLTDQQERKTTYKTHVDGKNLTVLIEGRRCRDSMSDESFKTTVSVTLDQKKYQGCGRALH